MSSKWCSNCELIVSTNTKPNYCCWCGKDLRNEEVLPEFNTAEEREAIIAGLRKPKEPAQLKLF